MQINIRLIFLYIPFSYIMFVLLIVFCNMHTHTHATAVKRLEEALAIVHMRVQVPGEDGALQTGVIEEYDGYAHSAFVCT